MPSFTIADIERLSADQFPGSRARCVEVGDGFAVAQLDTADTDLRPGGFISGPTQFSLLDATFWFATFVAIDRVEPMALTSELSIRYLRPAVGERLTCRADVAAVSRRSVVLSGAVWVDDRSTTPSAIAQGTYALPLPR